MKCITKSCAQDATQGALCENCALAERMLEEQRQRAERIAERERAAREAREQRGEWDDDTA